MPHAIEIQTYMLGRTDEMPWAVVETCLNLDIDRITMRVIWVRHGALGRVLQNGGPRDIHRDEVFTCAGYGADVISALRYFGSGYYWHAITDKWWDGTAFVPVRLTWDAMPVSKWWIEKRKEAV